jgi:nondiscriminating aspartyl-tRNA synthetase
MQIIGWLESKRKLNSINFLILRNHNGIKQIVCKNKNLFSKFKSLKRESLIKVFCKIETYIGNSELHAIDILILKLPSFQDYPFQLQKFKLKSNRNTLIKYKPFSLKSRNLYLLYVLKSKIINNMRNYLINNLYTQVYTPKIISRGSQGGSELFKIDYFGDLNYLTQSPQLYKQIIINSGFYKIFEIGNIYRAEKSDTNKHLSQAICLDLEFETEKIQEVIIILKDLVKLANNSIINSKEVKELGYNLKELKDQDFKIIPYYKVCEILDQNINYKLKSTDEIKILEKLNSRFCFIINWPKEYKPFYIKSDKNIAYGVDLISRFAEISSGGLRETQYNKLYNNIVNSGLDQKGFESYLSSFKYSPPEHAGFSIGIDRLICQILNLEDIRDIVMFPRDKTINKP